MLINITDEGILFHSGPFPLLPFVISSGRSQRSLVFLFFCFPLHVELLEFLPTHLQNMIHTSFSFFYMTVKQMSRTFCFQDEFTNSQYASIYFQHIWFWILWKYMCGSPFTISHFLLPNFIPSRLCYYSLSILFLYLWVGALRSQ